MARVQTTSMQISIYQHGLISIEPNESYGEFPKLYYTSFYEMPEILVDGRRFLQYIFTYFHLTGTWGDWGVYSI